MSPDEQRLLELLYTFSSAANWHTLNRMAQIDQQISDHRSQRAREAETIEEAEAIINDGLDSSIGRTMNNDAHELHRRLLVAYPDLIAGFPVPDYPDLFEPQERAKQCAAILATFVIRTTPTAEEINNVRDEAKDRDRPSVDRQKDILVAIRGAKEPLQKDELKKLLEQHNDGALPRQLSWLVKNNVLINIPKKGYWFKGEDVPNDVN